ncbi:MAG: ABC transporter substrate-binding protein [Desertimonas sp.]
MKRRWGLGLVAAAMAMTACAADDGARGGGGGPFVAVAAAPRTAPDDTTADGSSADAEIDPDGVLRVATFAEYPWDPHLNPNTYGLVQLSLVYDRLVHTAPDGTLIPGLAESWEYSDDGTTLTLSLRQGVTFQDGEVFDAEAVKANLDRAMTLEGSTVAPELVNVSEVVADDASTVTLRLAAPDATLPAVLSGLAGLMISPPAMDDPALDQNPVGAGMYRLAELTQGAGFTVERWDGYWDPEAVQAASIEWSFVPDTNARVNALTTGQIDIAPIEPFDVDRVEQADGIEVRLNDTLRFVYLGLDLSVEPFNDLRVRQAIAHAIDREALVAGVWLGFGTPSEQIWPEGYFPHVPELDDRYPYDPERARELLAEAGLEDGFSFESIVVPQPAAYQQLGEAIQAQLAAVGIDMSIRITEASQLGTAYYVEKVAPSAVLYTNGRLDPALTVGGRYAESGFFNVGKVSTPRLEELFAESISETDEAARTEIFQQMSTEITDQLLDQVLFFAQEPQGVSDRVVGLESYISGIQEFRGVGVAAG